MEIISIAEHAARAGSPSQLIPCRRDDLQLAPLPILLKREPTRKFASSRSEVFSSTREVSPPPSVLSTIETS